MGDMVTSEDIGLLIRKYRQDAGLSQEKLAEMVGVSFQQIQKYENGSTMLNTDKLQRVATALKVPASAFFEDDTYEKPPLSDRERKLIKAFEALRMRTYRMGWLNC